MDDLEKGHTGALDEPLSGPKASPARVTRNPLSMESHTKTEMRQTSAPRIESIPKKASGNITSASETQALPTSSPDPRTSQGPQYSGPQAKEFTEKTSVEQDYRNILRQYWRHFRIKRLPRKQAQRLLISCIGSILPKPV